MDTKNISRGNLRAFRAAATVGLLSFFISCTPDSTAPMVCETGECDAYIESMYYKDENGYTHVDLDWNSEYLPYFTIDIHATRTVPQFYYNDQPVVSAEFDTDTYFVLGDSLAFVIPLYSPYLGLETYEGFPIPVRDTIVYLNQFAGTVLPIVQNDTRVYFSDDTNGEFTTRRTVGPFPPTLEGDTISIYMKVLWDAGMESVLKEDYYEKYIIE